MRHLATAVAVLAFAGGVACAQYKTPPGTPAVPMTANPAVQITPAVPTGEESLEAARRINREDAIKMVKEGKAVWVDVRPKDQFEQEHIKGAMNIPLSDLQGRFKDLPVQKFIITYCA